MKLSAILMVIFTLQLSAATGFGQFSFTSEGKKVREVLNIIEKESNYRFFYNDEFEFVDKVIDLKFSNQNINQVLDKLLASSDYTYKIFENNLIVFSLKDDIREQSVFQQNIVKGTVTDEQGNPLTGVTVVVKGTTRGTTSDVNGNYIIVGENPNSILVLSFIGYKNQEIVIGNRSKIDIVLEEELVGLDEVVVIGYGGQQRRAITAAISSVSGEQLTNRPIASVGEALQGLVPGLNIIRFSGQPGNQSINYKIRGTSTFTTNPVLFIVDGVPSSIEQINPIDIESISVLKDAAAASIYGSRATGGVILITTKTGQMGEPRVNYSGTISLQSPSRYSEKVSALDHAILQNEGLVNDGGSPFWSEADIQRFSSPNWKDYDWEGYVFNNALEMKHNLSISGGTKSQDYYLSIGYLKQDGIVINSDYKRFNIQLNENVRLFNDKLKLGFKGSYVPSTRTSPSLMSKSGSISALLTRVLQMPATQPFQTPDGKKWLQTASQSGSGINVISRMSPDGGQEVLKPTRVTGNLSLDFEIIPDLIITGTYGLVNEQYRCRDYAKKITWYKDTNPDEIASVAELLYTGLAVRYSSTLLQNSSLLVNYEKIISDHKITALAGVTAEWYIGYSDKTINRDFLTDEIYVISAGSGDNTLWAISGTAEDWALASFISRATYSYKDRYLFTGTLRYDGSSRFKEDLRWGLFPSISAGWIVSEENFLKNNPVLTYLKLRGSWGMVGNQNVGFYPFINTLTQSTVYFNESPQTSVGTKGDANPMLTWETKETFNIGIGGSIFANLFEFNIDLFQEKTKDILLRLPVPTTYGLTAPVQNAGIVQNRGWELELKHRNTFGNFSYGIAFQMADATNKVLDLGGVTPVYDTGRNFITEEGHPMYEYFGWKAIGFFQTPEEVASSSIHNSRVGPGDIKYLEVGGDPKTITSADRVRLGRSDPRFPFGINVNLDYKNFSLTVLGQGVMSFLVPMGGATGYNAPGANQTCYVYHLDRWTPENRDARFPKTRNLSINRSFSSFWLQSAAYFRLKNIELGYNIPDNVLERIKIRGARVFISGENLFTITDYLGFDPETSVDMDNNVPTNDRTYPIPKLFNLGVNVNF